MTRLDPHTVVFTFMLCKSYHGFEGQIVVLKDVNLEVRRGEFIVIGGPSGSGKTTLLNLIGGIDKPTSGKVVVFDEELDSKNEDFLAGFRCANIGFVFQSYNLVSTLTVSENIAFPMEWVRTPHDEIQSRVEELLQIVGLAQRSEHFPFQLSGGEQQRVAFARALANDPPLLLVDEPTGNLDTKTSAQIVKILQNMREHGKTLIVVSHDLEIIGFSDRSLRLEEGRLLSHNE